MHRRLALVSATFAASGLLLAACADEASSPEIPTTAVTATAAPSATAISTPGGTATGIAIVDDVIAAVAGGNTATLAALIRPQRVPCANVQGLGGPPDCGAAPGAPPEGTIVDAFPFYTCEREWLFDLDTFAERWLTLIGDLYAVVRIDTPTPPEESPDGGYGIIYENVDPAVETAHALIVTDAGIVSADSLCGGLPEAFLEDGPPFDAPEVIYEGPAFD